VTIISCSFFDSGLLLDTFQRTFIWIGCYSHIKTVIFRDENIHLSQLGSLIHIHWKIYSIITIWYWTNKITITFIRDTHAVNKQLWWFNKSFACQTQILLYFCTLICNITLYNAISVHFCQHTWPDFYIWIYICSQLVIFVIRIKSRSYILYSFISMCVMRQFFKNSFIKFIPPHMRPFINGWPLLSLGSNPPDF